MYSQLAKSCEALFVGLPLQKRPCRFFFLYLHRSLLMPYRVAINPSCARSRLMLALSCFESSYMILSCLYLFGTTRTCEESFTTQKLVRGENMTQNVADIFACTCMCVHPTSGYLYMYASHDFQVEVVSITVVMVQLLGVCFCTACVQCVYTPSHVCIHIHIILCIHTWEGTKCALFILVLHSILLFEWL